MKYKSESSINKMLAELQIVNANVADTTESQDTFEKLIREAIQSENEAIKIYIKLKEQFEHLGSKNLAKAMEEIRNDETKHVGNLTYLLKIFCPDSIDVEKEGETEEAKLQAEVES